jgi:hypothetical protein
MNSSELFNVLCFGVTVAFHVTTQICFAAETARAMWALVKVADVYFRTFLLFHPVSFLNSSNIAPVR